MSVEDRAERLSDHSFVLDVWAADYSLPLYLTQSLERSGQ